MNTKLILAILRPDIAGTIMNQLIEAGFRVTEFSSMGAFFRRTSTTLVIGAPSGKLDRAMTIIRSHCPSAPDQEEHSATIFVIDAGQFIHI